jgi:hypothetical protein
MATRCCSQFNPAGPNIVRDEQMHRNRHYQRDAAEAPCQQADAERDL